MALRDTIIDLECGPDGRFVPVGSGAPTAQAIPTAAPAIYTDTPAAFPPSRPSVWPWVIGGGVVLALLATTKGRSRRRSPPTRPAFAGILPSNLPKWAPWALGGTLIVGLLYAGRSVIVPFVSKAVDFAKFKLALLTGTRSPASQYASLLWSAGQSYNVDPFLLAGIAERESHFGAALWPKHGKPPMGRADGTGDWTARPKGWSISTHGVPHATLPPGAGGSPGWSPHPSGRGAPPPPYMLPPDGLGWGRGLMQIDFNVHYPWVTTNDWGDPTTNINKAAEILASNLRFFRAQGLSEDTALRAAVANYNLGDRAFILANVKAGRSPDLKTTGGEYSAYVVGAAQAFQSKAV